MCPENLGVDVEVGVDGVDVVERQPLAADHLVILVALARQQHDVAGQEPHQEEDDDGHAEQRGDHEEHALHHVPEHERPGGSRARAEEVAGRFGCRPVHGYAELLDDAEVQARAAALRVSQWEQAPIGDRAFRREQYTRLVKQSEPLIAEYLGVQLPEPISRVYVHDRREWLEANFTSFEQLFRPIEDIYERNGMRGAAAVLLGVHEPVYQLGTSDENRVTSKRLTDMTGLAVRRLSGEGAALTPAARRQSVPRSILLDRYHATWIIGRTAYQTARLTAARTSARLPSKVSAIMALSRFCADVMS